MLPCLLLLAAASMLEGWHDGAAPSTRWASTSPTGVGRRELTLRQLAELTGVSNPYLSQIERGLRRPSAEVLQQLSKALRVSAESLYVRAGILDPDDHTASTVEMAAAGRHHDQRAAQAGAARRLPQLRRRGRGPRPGTGRSTGRRTPAQTPAPSRGPPPADAAADPPRSTMPKTDETDLTPVLRRRRTGRHHRGDPPGDAAGSPPGSARPRSGWPRSATVASSGSSRRA